MPERSETMSDDQQNREKVAKITARFAGAKTHTLWWNLAHSHAEALEIGIERGAYGAEIIGIGFKGFARLLYVASGTCDGG